MAETKIRRSQQSGNPHSARSQILKHLRASHTFWKNSNDSVNRLHLTCLDPDPEKRLHSPRSQKSHANRLKILRRERKLQTLPYNQKQFNLDREAPT